jgi:hypothetical protein
MATYDIKEVLMRRDGLSDAEADRLLDQLYEDLMEATENGEDPDEVLMDQVGLEPDYLEGFLY